MSEQNVDSSSDSVEELYEKIIRMPENKKTKTVN